MRFKKKLFMLVLTICLVLSAMGVPVGATEMANSTNQAILDARNGVLQVALGITIDDVYFGSTTVGTGFLLGEDGSAQTLITNYHVIHSYDEQTLKEVLIQAGFPVTADSKIKLDVRVVINRDVPILATVVKESVQSDYSILTLEQPIYDRHPLTLTNSDNVAVTQEVFALGFPGLIVEGLQLDAVYSADDVVVTDGRVSKKNDVRLVDSAIPCLTHSAQVTFGNSGGPLVDANGYVVGVNTAMTQDQNYSVATQINEVRNTLDSLGITYNYADESAPAPTASEENIIQSEAPEESDEPAVTVDTADLEAKIQEARAKVDDGKKYTTESMGALETAIENAEATLNDDAISQNLVDNRVKELDKALDNMEEVKGMNLGLLIAIIAIAVVILILVIVLIFVSKSGKNKSKSMTPPPVSGRDSYQQDPFGQNQRQPQNMGYQQPQAYNQYGNEGAGETSVLSEGAGETTVLGSSGGAGSAYLIRMKTGEKITLNSPNFTIGKEKRRVNYCISDNSSISRCHARIARKGAQYYIVDMNSTNFTFVNGTKAAANMEVPLTDNAKIKLSDEDFEFHIG